MSCASSPRRNCPSVDLEALDVEPARSKPERDPGTPCIEVNPCWGGELNANSTIVRLHENRRAGESSRPELESHAAPPGVARPRGPAYEGGPQLLDGNGRGEAAGLPRLGDRRRQRRRGWRQLRDLTGRGVQEVMFGTMWPHVGFTALTQVLAKSSSPWTNPVGEAFACRGCARRPRTRCGE
jgi:hypothetical protein